MNSIIQSIKNVLKLLSFKELPARTAESSTQSTKRFLLMGMNCEQANQQLWKADFGFCYLCKRMDGDCSAALDLEENVIGTMQLQVRAVTIPVRDTVLLYYVCHECLALVRGINSTPSVKQ